MRNSLRTIIFSTSLFISVICVNFGYASVLIATNSGKWEEPATWEGGIIPKCGDSINIPTGITVHINSVIDFNECGKSMHLNVSGVLHFQSGKKIRLSCHSRISVTTGGIITATAVSGNPSLIEICNSSVWNVAMGSVKGPKTIKFTPEPVKLVHFSGHPDHEGVTLSWMSVSETNSASFTIEKGKDGKNFKELITVDGAGTSTKINSYEIVDKNPFEGVQYYRLRHTNFNGISTVSGMVGIRWSALAEFQIYPNPTRGELFANVNPNLSGNKGNLYINSANGKLLLTKEITIEESGHGISLLSKSETLKPGSYMVTLSVKDKSYTQYVVSK